MIIRLFWVALLAGGLAACATRTVDQRVIDRPGVEVFLRHRVEDGQEVERGYAHPLVVSPERLASILSRLEVKSSARRGILGSKPAERRPAVDAALLELVAGALAEAFAQAGPNQEVVVRAVQTRRRLALFVRHFVTGFTASAEDDTLYLDFSLVDWEVPIPEEEGEDVVLPMPRRGERMGRFRLLPGHGMRVDADQRVAVSWRDPSLERPEPAAEGLPGLSPEKRRALTDLEAAREQGEITESYYQRQRDKLIQRDGHPP